MARRLSAILSADVVGYSRLMGEDEAGTLAQVKAHRKELIDPKIAEHNGRIVKLMGDGALVEFTSVVDAVECATEIQRSMRKRNADVPEARRIEFRIGINLGDIIIDGDDIYGDGVNVAARLQELAEPGAVCFSDKVYAEVQGKTDLAFENLGEHRVKNIVRPVRVFQVLIAENRLGAPTDVSQPVPGFGGRPAIAVLPFENMSGDPEQEYFADGIAEDILTRLAMWRWLPVIARNSSFTYKGRAIDVKDVGRELGARYVLEGSVRKAGNRVRISGQLIDSETGHHVWAERYDRALEDVFAVQDEITEAIVAALEPAVGRAEMQRANRENPESLDAWDLYQRGMWYLNKITKEDIEQAGELFQRSAAEDQNFAAARAGIALVGFFRLVLGTAEHPASMLASAHEAALNAVRCDELDPFAQAALAYTSTYSGQYNAGITAARRAIELNPSFALGYHAHFCALFMDGQFREGVDAAQRGIRISPSDPWLFLFFGALAAYHYMVRDYERAVEAAKMCVQRFPQYASGHRWLAAALAQLGRTDEARDALAKFLDRSPNYAMERARHLYRFRHEKDVEHVLDGLRKAGLPK
ncbi:MAG: adenylate/guanylate cyclase domain-containing protein [Kiloniellales bacterium]